MSEHPTWAVGNRNPSVSETITADGVAVDLSSSTVKFKMRQVGSSTLKVDTSAVVVSAPAGTVRYDWAAADVDTAGDFLIWWEVSTAGKTQDMMEAVISFLPHAPGTNAYVELEELKSTLEITSAHANSDLLAAAVAASRAIDQITNRRFYLDPDATQVRYYTPNPAHPSLWVDDIATLTSLQTDDGGDGTFENTWTLNSDFTLEPLNAAADSRPWTTVRRHPDGDYQWPVYPRSVKVTAKFGWAAVPAVVKEATTLLANRLMKRAKMAPFSVVTFGADGTAVRVAREDPDVMALLQSVTRQVPFA